MNFFLTDREFLEELLQAASNTPVQQLPRLVGRLEEARVVAMARLSAPPAPTQADELLNVAEAAKRLGVSEDYLYRHHREFSFARRMGRAVRFSANGLQQHIASQQPK